MDGYSIELELLGDEKTRNLPVIITTGLAPSKKLFDNIPAVKCFLCKPFTAEEIIAAVNKVFMEKE